MDTQSIDNQLELLRLKELFMSDIDIRSKMAMLICREEDPSYSEFCQLTHCTLWEQQPCSLLRHVCQVQQRQPLRHVG